MRTEWTCQVFIVTPLPRTRSVTWRGRWRRHAYGSRPSDLAETPRPSLLRNKRSRAEDKTRIVRRKLLVAFNSFTRRRSLLLSYPESRDDHNPLIKQQASYILLTEHKSSLLPEFRSTGNNPSRIKLFFFSYLWFYPRSFTDCSIGRWSSPHEFNFLRRFKFKIHQVVTIVYICGAPPMSHSASDCGLIAAWDQIPEIFR